jgi:DNA-binding NtrC family response regulator
LFVEREIKAMIKILIIEDTLLVAEMLTVRLTKEGYNTIFYTNPVDAVEDMKVSKYDIIISDLEMPDVGGEEILELVTESYRDISLILMSGNFEKLSSINCNHKLEKPFDFEELLSMISRIIIDKKLS